MARAEGPQALEELTDPGERIMPSAGDKPSPMVSGVRVRHTVEIPAGRRKGS